MDNNINQKNNKFKQIFRYQFVYVALLILMAAAVIMNINTGNVHISPVQIGKIIFLKGDSGTPEYNIIWKIRLPRLCMAAILGGALSLSGFLLQTFFRNPIAGPFVLGISSGAKMFVAITMIFLLEHVCGMPLWAQVAAAFVGSLFAMLYVLFFANKVKSMSMLLVVGIMISYICSAITDLCITFANDSNIANLTHWAMGSFSGSSWATVKLAAFIIFPTAIVTFLFSKPISAYLLGEGYAQSMGINIKFFRVCIVLLSSLLSACVTALAGPISFVGIAVPHITRLSLKTTKPLITIPAIFLSGSVFCMFCDLIARTIFSPSELAIGTVTAIFGAPVVICLMIKQKK